ncbi:hypothetical protein RB614_15735 [Phytohabitans sp. ZYX-F-186]|uniref:FXSXX-COOH protein n=1 Tax=Phytohabitans maris TaxID=3071409 RepID=A0ABU0ZHR4_9ACTN|nr:hypothetical protein [Phytohabitans sp. ZYX-F-186]MDQ7905964.1 hypothetical protein [Phytohabitans sp. ZYX-F-186]
MGSDDGDELIRRVVHANHPAHPVPPAQATAAELRARADRSDSDGTAAQACGPAADEDVRVPLLDLTSLRLPEVLDSDDTVLADCLRRLLRDLAEPGEIYAAHGSTPAFRSPDL